MCVHRLVRIILQFVLLLVLHLLLQLQSAQWDVRRARLVRTMFSGHFNVLIHRTSTGIVYIDEIDKLSRRGGGGSGPEGARDVGGEGVQQALLRMMEGGTVTVQAKSIAEGPGTGNAAGPIGAGSVIPPGPDARRARGNSTGRKLCPPLSCALFDN